MDFEYGVILVHYKLYDFHFPLPYKLQLFFIIIVVIVVILVVLIAIHVFVGLLSAGRFRSPL